MLQSELEALKTGDKVIYNDHHGWRTCTKGTVLTRKEGWLDDDHSVRFNFTDNDINDFHFFTAEEVDLIKE